MNRNKLLLSAVIILSILIVSACSGNSTSSGGETNRSNEAEGSGESSGSDGEDAYYIGALLALTGNCSGLGQPTKPGIEFQVEKINQQNKLSKPLKVSFADDRSEPSETVALTNRFIDDDKNLAIIGYSCSNLALAAKPVVNEKEITQVAFAIAPEITDPVMPYTFTMTPTVKEEVATSIQYVTNQGIKKIALLYEDTSYPKQAAAEWKNLVKEFGIEIVVEEMYPPDTKDLSVPIFKAKKEDIDAIIIEGTTNSAALASKTAKQQGIDVPMLFSSGATNPDFLELTGSDSEGNLAVTVGYASVFERLPDDFPNVEELRKTAAEFKEFSGRSIDMSASAGMDLVSLVAEAISIAEEKGEVNRQTVRDAFETISDLQGMLSFYNYSPENHIGASNATPILKVQDGQWNLFKTPEEVLAESK